MYAALSENPHVLNTGDGVSSKADGNINYNGYCYTKRNINRFYFNFVEKHYYLNISEIKTTIYNLYIHDISN